MPRRPGDPELPPFIEGVISFFEGVENTVSFAWTEAGVSKAEPCVFCGDATNLRLLSRSKRGTSASAIICADCRSSIISTPLT